MTGVITIDSISESTLLPPGGGEYRIGDGFIFVDNRASGSGITKLRVLRFIMQPVSLRRRLKVAVWAMSWAKPSKVWNRLSSRL